MTLPPFNLKPFAPGPESLGITCAISRKDDALHICFTLNGPLNDLIIPLPDTHPERRDNLWQESCLEFFFAEVGSTAYWEVNLAPSGHWNVFVFDCYRQDMRREEKVSFLPISIAHAPRTFTLKTVLDLSYIGLTEKPLQVGVSAVILSTSRNFSYWALAHPSGKPDFHERKGFILSL